MSQKVDFEQEIGKCEAQLSIVEGLSIVDGDVHVGSNNMGASHIKAFPLTSWLEITTDINGWFEITTDHFLEAH